MKLLRVNVSNLTTTYEDLPEEWQFTGGRGLGAKILSQEVPPLADPLGPENKLIIAAGPLAGTIAPELGRLSVCAKSPLTLGVKEANAGGPAAQKMDRLGIRAIIVEGQPAARKLYCLKIGRDGATLLPADEYRGMKNYALAEALYKKYPGTTLVSIGTAGERKYRSASVTCTDMNGDPSRNAGRGGMGAVMGAKGLKAIIIDDSGTSSVPIADQTRFREVIRDWVATIHRDVSCGLFSQLGTPLVVASNSYQGTMPADNYRTGRPASFRQITGEAIKRTNTERGGKMHACMPGCVVQCSIIYNGPDGKRLTSAYEYEGLSLIGTNLGISDLDAIARMKHICDDIGVDFIEIGASMSLAADAGNMKMGDADSALKLLLEVEKGSELGGIIANGIVATAKAFNISRVPAFKGQAMPAHDGRAVKGLGVTYATSPQGADHTAGLTYRSPREKTGQVVNSLRSQIQNAVCDAFGYCINAVPGGQASIYSFLADMLNARFGAKLSGDDIFEMGKQVLRDELKFNSGAEFSKHERYPAFFRTEPLPPTNCVFDVDDAELDTIWKQMETLKLPAKVWEVRFPVLPNVLFGAGVVERLGEQAKRLGMKKAMLITDPVMVKLGRAVALQNMLKKSGIDSVVFSDVEPDPPIEEIEKAGKFYHEHGCDGLIALGGGSSMDAAKATAVRVTHSGLMAEYEANVGGTAKIKGPLPPVICIPTTSGTGSEMNQTAVLSDKQRGMKFPLLSELITPKASIIDPQLCKTMPPVLTADTGLDVLAHCFESYVSRNIMYHPYYEALALEGTQLVGRSLRVAYNSGDDIDARTDMCMAAALAGVALARGLGLAHAIGHTLGTHYHMAHGRACALGMVSFVRANKKVCEKQFRDLAYALDGSQDIEAALLNLLKDLNVPSHLRDAGIPEVDLPRIATATTFETFNLSCNPAPLTEQQILALLKEQY